MTKGSKNQNIIQKVESISDNSENESSTGELQQETSIKYVAMMNYRMLPLVVKKRVHALKNLQIDTIKIEQEFYKELHNLEVKFSEQFQVVFNKRNEIVTGEREPTTEEADFDSECEDQMDDMVEEFKNKAFISNGGSSENGIPSFWMKVLQNSHVGVNIQENDVDVLKHLVDLKCVLKSGEENGFVLEFYFSPNEYFTNDKLTKQYFIQMNVSDTYPLGYDGPEIVRTKGCVIDWCRGKNITIKMVKKVKKGKKGEAKQTTSVAVKTDSFFNFFDPPTDSLESEEMIESDIVNLLEADFEMGDYIRENVIPRAVTYYTGEEVDDEDDEFEDEEEDDCDDEDCDSHEDKSSTRKALSAAAAPECKQQ